MEAYTLDTLFSQSFVGRALSACQADSREHTIHKEGKKTKKQEGGRSSWNRFDYRVDKLGPMYIS